jgi:SAM-dependent methyltransferase
MTDPNDSLEFWQNQYSAGTIAWDRGSAHPAIVDWLQCGELSPCQIVVPGCGRGHEVIHLSRLGFDVTAVDYAAAPIEFLTRQLATEGLSATALHRDLFSWDHSRTYDAVYEQTCLCAIRPELRTRYEDRVFQWLRPGGKLFLLLAQTDIPNGPPFHCEPDEMKNLFSDNRWEWQSTGIKQYTHPSGRLHELAAILVRKQEKSKHGS